MDSVNDVLIRAKNGYIECYYVNDFGDEIKRIYFGESIADSKKKFFNWYINKYW